ncbi:hypothetical protein Cgig2_032189 [Carnegiea gigantea]|uniref:Alpha-1,4 glucan phosphorylase n=1 Tax=Carnegiea gigantea TaxID=171969 RepID=A0A9Q1JM90_9CARY|nr:hypothetical protein Cgig2_032189 [Carnegiea gigantea]
MATLPLSTPCRGTETCSRCHSISRIINLSSRNGVHKLFLSSIRPSGSRRVRRSLSVKSVLGERKKKLEEIGEEGYPTILNPPSPDSTSVASSVKYHAEFSPLFAPEGFSLPKAFYATAQSVRDSLIVNWNATYEYYDRMNMKQAYYLSMEFLQGRALLNAIGNLELTGPYGDALKNLGHNLEAVASQEPDAALGNGGLGRLASCFLDSLATLNYPAWGYGLRYRYGLFKQQITTEGQEEVAENWLEICNPWEIVRNDVSYPVKFFGKVVSGSDGERHWIGGEDIKAVAYDVPIPGYKTKTTGNLRLWSTTVPSEDFDLDAFNSGEHMKANEAQANAEMICYVLYPGDESTQGKILRLKQQYTLCSASLQDIIARFERRSGERVKWEEFPEKYVSATATVHHQFMADLKSVEEGYLENMTVAYTNHTVLPEALEKWSFEVMEKLLPRHVEIIQKIDEELAHTIISEYGDKDTELLRKKLNVLRILENVELPSSVASLIKEKTIVRTDENEETEVSTEEKGSDDVDEEEEEEKEKDAKASKKAPKEQVPEPPKMVRMANLAVVGGHAVNGVAEIHSAIVKDEVFSDFYELWPEKFQNKTNGVTPRRWIRFCNPNLSRILTKWIGSEDWVLNTEKLAVLRKFADDKDLHAEWIEAKRNNKLKLVSFIEEKTGYTVSPDAMFDIQVKRIHEYKRQLLNVLGIVYRYKKMKEMSATERKVKYVPRVCIFGGKAFSTYVQAKRIVKFIIDVGATINRDPEIGDLLKVIFVPDYNVSVAELLIPASELSQHISTAGMEASGTSNMKFAMNGCVLIGTMDGANVEIREEVGEENFFLFGARAEEIAGLRKERAEGKFVPDPRFEEVKDYVRSGVFGTFDYDELLGSLEGNEGFGRGDYFLVGQDFPSYIECQEKVDEAYRDQRRWTRMSIMNTAGSPKFSSDRTIREYAKDIWNIKPAELP